MNEYKGSELEPSHHLLFSPPPNQQHTAKPIVILITFHSQILQWLPGAPIKRNNIRVQSKYSEQRCPSTLPLKGQLAKTWMRLHTARSHPQLTQYQPLVTALSDSWGRDAQHCKRERPGGVGFGLEWRVTHTVLTLETRQRPESMSSLKPNIASHFLDQTRHTTTLIYTWSGIWNDCCLKR